VKNYKVTVKEINDTIVFLRKIIRGHANRSFGVEVAQLAGVPEKVIERAKEISLNLEKVNQKLDMNIFGEDEERSKQEKNNKLGQQLLSILRDMDINRMSPIESFEVLNDLIAEIKDSKTVTIAYHVTDPNVGLSGSIDLCRFKLFLADTGLFTTLMFQDRDFTENIIYEKLLSDKLPANLGYLYENVVAQMLTAGGNDLYYHTFLNQSTRHNYEVDFLLAKRNKICPLEVKSSGYKVHASLDAFCEKFSERIGEKYLLYTKDFQKDQDIFCMPVYMTPFLVDVR